MKTLLNSLLVVVVVLLAYESASAITPSQYLSIQDQSLRMKKKGKKKKKIRQYTGTLNATFDSCSGLEGRPSIVGQAFVNSGATVEVRGRKAKIKGVGGAKTLKGKANKNGFQVKGTQKQVLNGQTVFFRTTISAQRTSPSTTVHAYSVLIQALNRKGKKAGEICATRVEGFMVQI